MAEQLSKERRNLTSLVEDFQKTKDPALQQQILKQADALRRRIQELMARMAELMKGVRDEHVNMEAMKELAEERDLQGQMDQVQKLLQEGKTEQALMQLQKLASQIDQVQKSLDQAQKSQGKSNPELVKKFQEFSSSLKKAEEDQRRVAQSTKEIRDRYKAQMKQRLKQKGDPRSKSS